MRLNFFIFKKAYIILILAVLFACNERKKETPKLEGELKLYVGISIKTHDYHTTLKSTGTDNFKVSIYDSDSKVIKSYNKASDIPSSIVLPEGDYYVIAHSGNNQPAKFENPFYQGISGTFTITPKEPTEIEVICSLSNVMITVSYSDNVASGFDNFHTIVKAGSDSLTFNEDESRAGYFQMMPIDIISYLEFTDSAGNKATKKLTGTIQDPQPQKHYEIHVDASITNGNAIINIGLNDTVDTDTIFLDDKEDEQPLIFTEIMFNPDNMSDSHGEWLELRNISDKEFNLKDLVIRRSNNDFHKITDDLIIAPGAFIVFAKTDSAVFEPGYVYGSSLSLINGGDELFINEYGTDGTDGDVICSVNYGGPGFPSSSAGRSIQLDPTISDQEGAIEGSNWCLSTNEYSTGDKGTPGEANSSCF